MYRLDGKLSKEVPLYFQHSVLGPFLSIFAINPGASLSKFISFTKHR